MNARQSGLRSALGHAAALIALLPMLSRPVTAQSLDGFWQSDGYGLLVEIQGPRMTTFQTTSISCMRWWTARRPDRSDPSSEAVFDRGDAEIRLTRGSSSDELLMRQGPAISSVRLTRASGQPRTCRETVEDTPPNNYAVFWQTFAEQFALFPVYRTDWGAIDRTYRPRVTPSTSPEELFDVLRAMILPFHNAHTNINAASIGRQYLGYRPVSEIGRRLQATSSLSIEEILALFKQEARGGKAIIESRYSIGPLRAHANEMIDFGMLKDSIGYLRILAFEGYTKDGSYEQGAATLQAVLDEVFAGAEGMKGLIIDVRVNTGGADPLALAIASRLAGAKYLAYSKVTRNNRSGPLHFTEPQAAWVDMSARPGYRGPVVLLIGPETISGGETFAMALMGRIPRVTFVGENTQGVFSDVWGRRLPNGWTFGVPTELYLTSSGKSFDGHGVPPDVRVSVFPKRDLEGGRDGALERAIRLILDHVDGVEGLAMVVIRGPVEFRMGSPPGEVGRNPATDSPDEAQHTARIPRSYAISAHEVTVAQFRRFLDAHPEVKKRHVYADDPARMDDVMQRFSPDPAGPQIAVTWYEAAMYCNWLSERAGLPQSQWVYPPRMEDIGPGMRMPRDYLHRTGYRLPTEAEWEYAARAGTTTSRFFGDSESALREYAWYSRNPPRRKNDPVDPDDPQRTFPVGRLKANPFGLFDVYGNVWEWTQSRVLPYPANGVHIDVEDDIFFVSDSAARVRRGGGFPYGPEMMRSAARGTVTAFPFLRRDNVGFRVARTMP